MVEFFILESCIHLLQKHSTPVFHQGKKWCQFDCTVKDMNQLKQTLKGSS